MSSIISTLAGRFRSRLYDGEFASALYRGIVFDGSIMGALTRHAKPLTGLFLLALVWTIFLLVMFAGVLWGAFRPSIRFRKWLHTGHSTIHQLLAKICWICLGLMFALFSVQVFYDNYRAAQTIKLRNVLQHTKADIDRLTSLEMAKLSYISNAPISTVVGVAIASKTKNRYIKNLNHLYISLDEAFEIIKSVADFRFELIEDLPSKHAKQVLHVAEATKAALRDETIISLQLAGREFIITTPFSQLNAIKSPNGFSGSKHATDIYDVLEVSRYTLTMLYCISVLWICFGGFICFVFRRHRFALLGSLVLYIVAIGFWSFYSLHILGASMIGAFCEASDPNGTSKPIEFTKDGSLTSQSIVKIGKMCRNGSGYIEALINSINGNTPYKLGNNVSLHPKSKFVMVHISNVNRSALVELGNLTSSVTAFLPIMNIILDHNQQEYTSALAGLASSLNRLHEKAKVVDGKKIAARLRAALDVIHSTLDSLNNIITDSLGKTVAIQRFTRLAHLVKEAMETSLQLDNHLSDLLNMNQNVGLVPKQEISRHFLELWSLLTQFNQKCPNTGNLINAVHESICLTVLPGYDGVFGGLFVCGIISLMLFYLMFTNSKYRGVSREAPQTSYGSRYSERELDDLN